MGSPGVHGEVSWGPGDRLGDPWGALGSPWEALGSHLSPRGGSGGFGESGRDADTANAHICEGLRVPGGGESSRRSVKADRDEAPGGKGGACAPCAK